MIDRTALFAILAFAAVTVAVALMLGSPLRAIMAARVLVAISYAVSPAMLAALPKGIRATIEGLDLARKDLHALKVRLILVHEEEDGLVPASESRALMSALPSGQAKPFLVPGVGDVGTTFGVVGGVQLWPAVVRLLKERDGVPGPVAARDP